MSARPVRRRRSVARALEFLLRSHYLADEFPVVVTTTPFASFCAANHRTLPNADEGLRRVTMHGTFSAHRTTATRRVLALPHPASQLALCQIIANNHDAIAQTIRRSEPSLYDTAEGLERDRLFVGIDFGARTEREAEVLARYPFVLIADIGNFFHTIYSHSLPWAVLGKQTVKEVLELDQKDARRHEFNGHWANKLDVAIQRGNSRETFGIPVGPDTSRIIAEVLLSGLHTNPNAPFARILEGREGYRLVDDFFIGFDDEASARRCLDALRHALWEYNLHLNDGKTDIRRSTLFFDGGWKHEIDNFPIPEDDAPKQREAVQRLMEITLQNCHRRNDSLPASFFCARLTALPIMMTNFDFVRDCLLRVARDFTNCLKSVVRFVTLYRAHFGNADALNVMRRWCGQIFAAHGPRGHDLEIASALVVCGVLGISVDWTFLALGERPPSPVVLAVLGLLGADDLLEQPWDSWRPLPEDVGHLINGRYWLPHYEAVRRGWTGDASLIEAFAQDAFFTRLQDADVTFLDDSDLKGNTEAGADDWLDFLENDTAPRAPVRSARQSMFDGYE
jgi:hypothetical protein